MAALIAITIYAVFIGEIIGQSINQDGCSTDNRNIDLLEKIRQMEIQMSNYQHDIKRMDRQMLLYQERQQELEVELAMARQQITEVTGKRYILLYL